MASVALPPGSSSEADGEFHRDILPHIDVCLSAYGSPISPSIRDMATYHMRVAKLLQPTVLLIMRDQVQIAAKCGWVFAERGHFERAAFHLQAVKYVLEKSLGPENDRTMTSMLGLAGVYWGLGRLEEAIVLQQQVVETRARIFGASDERTLRAMDALGKSYWLHGMYKEALELQSITTKRLRAAFDKMHPRYTDTLSAMDNLGVTLGSWRRYEESLDIHEEVLRSRERLLGHAHQDTLTTKSNLAMALLDLGRVDEAQSYMLEVYHHGRQQLGKEPPWTLWSICYLAKVYIEARHLKEAQDMLEWGVEAGARSLTKNHLELARVYVRQGKLEQAEVLAAETVKLVEESRGVSHPDCIYGLWRLASLYLLRDKRTRALETAQLALGRVDMRITRAHPLGEDVEKMCRILADPSSPADQIESLKLVLQRPEQAHPHKSDQDSVSSIRLLSRGTSRTPTW
ncbi:hypothetical protein N0V93_008283 [Gnomoniopsis smithogilvyi]|uniref:Kinesin light chain n=1 Tax=Gnomoniopsis smithogilvyi TaxID=1191159 RepID=A0A9W8YPR7_9PEZI|nr:hypothetical protein N0V93_008283 [Gnomoniopsis smithogilvyi]